MSEGVNTGMSVDVDEEGYLLDYHQWDEAIAHALAEKEGVGELTPDKMEVIKFMRTYYEKFGFYPIMRYVCKNVHQAKECVNEEFIDPLKAVKIAGLPQPTGEVVAYLKDEVA
jgi:tRNA 2-thiouridine synthesizing protein E